jgi:hypothetical protein
MEDFRHGEQALKARIVPTLEGAPQEPKPNRAASQFKKRSTLDQARFPSLLPLDIKGII